MSKTITPMETEVTQNRMSKTIIPMETEVTQNRMSKLIVRDIRIPPEYGKAVEMTLEEKIKFYAMPLDVQLYYRQFNLALGEPQVLKPDDEHYWFSKQPCVLVPNVKVRLPRGKYGELAGFLPRSADDLTAWNKYLDGLPTETRNYILSIIPQDMTDSSLPSGAADSNVPRGSGKNKREWSSEEDAKLIDALLELHASGKYSGADNGFKPGYDKAVQALLDVSLPNSGLKANPHIRSRLKTLKKNFSIVHDMLSGTGGTSGFGWDSEKCVLTAPEDVWDAYIKEKKQAAPFKDKALPYYEKLCTVFGKDRATGARTEDLGDDEIVQETPPVSPIDVDMDVPISNGVVNKRKRSKTIECSDTFKECSIDLNVQETPPVSPIDVDMDVPISSGVVNKRKRSKTIECSDTFKECSIDLTAKLENSIGKLGEKIVASANQDIHNDILDEVITSIQGLPHITPQQRIRGMHIIGRNASKARIFLKSSEEDKIIYIQMLGDGPLD